MDEYLKKYIYIPIIHVLKINHFTFIHFLRIDMYNNYWYNIILLVCSKTCCVVSAENITWPKY